MLLSEERIKDLVAELFMHPSIPDGQGPVWDDIADAIRQAIKEAGEEAAKLCEAEFGSGAVFAAVIRKRLG